MFHQTQVETLLVHDGTVSHLSEQTSDEIRGQDVTWGASNRYFDLRNNVDSAAVKNLLVVVFVHCHSRQELGFLNYRIPGPKRKYVYLRKIWLIFTRTQAWQLQQRPGLGQREQGSSEELYCSYLCPPSVSPTSRTSASRILNSRTWKTICPFLENLSILWTPSYVGLYFLSYRYLHGDNASCCNRGRVTSFVQ